MSIYLLVIVYGLKKSYSTAMQTHRKVGSSLWPNSPTNKIYLLQNQQLMIC